MAKPKCTCKFGISRTCPAHGNRRDMDDLELFNLWWAKNHPYDWWANARDGEPLPHRDRLLVDELARRAFCAGMIARNNQ